MSELITGLEVINMSDFMGNFMLRRSMKIVGTHVERNLTCYSKDYKTLYFDCRTQKSSSEISSSNNHIQKSSTYSPTLFYPSLLLLKRTRSLASLSDHGLTRCFTSIRLVGCARQRSRLLLRGCFAASGLLSVTRRRQCQL